MSSIPSWLGSLSLAASVGTALSGGVFFAFSTFVMPALGRLPPREGLAAMQAINVTAINPLFMALLFGTAVLDLAVLVVALRAQGSGAGLAVAGAAFYLVGVIGMTVAFHVPRNEALATVSASDPEAPARFARYLASWVPGNHVRAVSAAVASVLLFVSAMGWRGARGVEASAPRGVAQNMMPM